NVRAKGRIFFGQDCGLQDAALDLVLPFLADFQGQPPALLFDALRVPFINRVKSGVVSSHQFGVIHGKGTPAFEPRMGAKVSLPIMLNSFSNFAMEDSVSCISLQRDYVESVSPFHAAGERKINVRSRYSAHHDPCKEHRSTS